MLEHNTMHTTPSVVVKEGETAAKVLRRLSKGSVLVDSAGCVVEEERVFVKKEKLDVCKLVKVFDPLNKEAYVLRYGGVGSELFWTTGLESHLMRVAGNKRVFLCKKFQARQCRAQSRCNSIHADRDTIQQLRKDHPVPADASREGLTITVFSKTDGECFTVPCGKILPTGADLSSQKGYLCNSYDANCALKCDLGKDCPNIHVETSYFRFLRSLWRTACCRQKDCLDRDGTAVKAKPGEAAILPEFRVAGMVEAYPSVKLAVTRGLRELNDEALKAHHTVLEIPATSICRPHQRKACKWGVDCNNVHICRNTATTETHLLDLSPINHFRQTYHQLTPTPEDSPQEEQPADALTDAELNNLIQNKLESALTAEG
eukprot:TRINITY_DN9914_c0_g1_i1.p1 TRINITY_DN9914_c0_g1~~TRINITY_DN9914_c0_g1_i1.p1  ORF type:complete len:374 (+),score=89.42 TRINITY_DN9914_c0_g1_i1:234-1355(+)